MGPGEVRRTERWLATARVSLATTALITVLIDPGEVHYSIWVAGLLSFYIAQSVWTMLLLRWRQQSTPTFRLFVHIGDIIWPALISIFATGQSNPFFLFLVFVLAAAAYRWGHWETIGTAAAAVMLLWIESLAFRVGLLHWSQALLARHHLTVWQLDASDFEPRRLLMRSISLIVLGVLIGYLAEQQKQLRAEKAVIARALGKARVEAGLLGTLQEIALELLSTFNARSLLIATLDNNMKRVHVGELSRENGKSSNFRWLEPSPSDGNRYLYESSASASYAVREHNEEHFAVIALDRDGIRLHDVAPGFLHSLAEKNRFDSVMAVSFSFGREWEGRLFLFDVSPVGEVEEELRFLQEIVRQVGPAVYNVLLLRRLRLRAGAAERARFARELHDGAVQSLIAVEMQVDVLRRQSGSKPELITDELGRIQSLLREEVLKLRELMQQMKTLDVDSHRLLALLHDTVERFQRETGISARFISEVEEVDMPQQVCRELARIVQEALVNVRKHSQAKQVLVRLTSKDGHWKVTIEDNGRGFPFAGRLSHTELESLRKGPLVIKERVRLIEGELAIQSTPGEGSRLEITIPQRRTAAYG